MKIKEIECTTALHKIKRKLPFSYELNIYRGCHHGCIYCYAIYSHDYLNDGNFFDTIYYKKNILENLEKELSSPKWKHEVISIGGVTDSYQPIEAKLKLMPEILKLMIKYKTPIIISTKSSLILRDIDLINELSKITYVNIAFTVTTMDEKVRKVIEPFASPSITRLKVLKKFKETNASVAVHIMPIIPYLTDNYENINEIYKIASEINVDYVLPGTLYLRGKTKPYFLNSIRNYDRKVWMNLLELYQNGRLAKEYKDELYKMINEIKEKYQISGNYMKGIKNKHKENEQLKFNLN